MAKPLRINHHDIYIIIYNIYIHTINVTIHTSTMDPMGTESHRKRAKQLRDQAFLKQS